MSDDLDLSVFDAIPDPLAARERRGSSGSAASRAPASEGDARPGSSPDAAGMAGAPGPSRQAVARRRTIGLGLAVLWLVVGALGLGLRHDLDSALLPVLIDAALPLLFGVAALSFALTPGRLGLGPRAGAALAFAVAAPVLLMGVVFVPQLLRGDPSPSVAALCHGASVCGAISLALGLVAWLIVSRAVRSAGPAGAWPRAALLGVATALLGAGALGMHCHDSNGWHVALGHVMPAIVVAAASVWLLGRPRRIQDAKPR